MSRLKITFAILLILQSHLLYALDIPFSVVILVTPTVYLHNDLAINKNASSSISPLGQRQAYLIGRELRQKYIENFRMLNSTPGFDQMRVTTNKQKLKSQTAHGILQGFFISGTGQTLKDPKLNSRALPPGPYQNFTNWTAPLRDAVLPHYFKPWPIKSTVLENDILFDADQTCPKFKVQIDQFAQRNSCASTNEATLKACKELYSVCKKQTFNMTPQSDNITCDCYNYVLSANYHSIKLPGNVSQTSMAIFGDICDQYTRNILGTSPESSQVKLMTEELLKDIGKYINETSKGRTINLYVISELQMKAMIISLNQEYPSKFPKYGAVIELEMFPSYDVKQAPYFIQMKVNNNKVKINDADKISNNEFLQMIEENLLSSFNSACYYIEPIKSSSSILLLLTATIGGGILLLIIFTCIGVHCLKNDTDSQEDDDFQPLNPSPGVPGQGSIISQPNEESKQGSILSGQPIIEHSEGDRKNLGPQPINSSSAEENKQASILSGQPEVVPLGQASVLHGQEPINASAAEEEKKSSSIISGQPEIVHPQSESVASGQYPINDSSIRNMGQRKMPPEEDKENDMKGSISEVKKEDPEKKKQQYIE